MVEMVDGVVMSSYTYPSFRLYTGPKAHSVSFFLAYLLRNPSGLSQTTSPLTFTTFLSAKTLDRMRKSSLA
jgi:hypothetical protein